MVLFIRRRLGKLHDDAALSASKWDIDSCAFPCHPHRQGENGIHGLICRKANTAFIRAARVVVLYTESRKDLKRPVVHAYRDAESKFTGGPAQYIAHTRVKVQHLSNPVELFLSCLKCIKLFSHDLLLKDEISKKHKRAPQTGCPL